MDQILKIAPLKDQFITKTARISSKYQVVVTNQHNSIQRIISSSETSMRCHNILMVVNSVNRCLARFSLNRRQIQILITELYKNNIQLIISLPKGHRTLLLKRIAMTASKVGEILRISETVESWIQQETSLILQVSIYHSKMLQNQWIKRIIISSSIHLLANLMSRCKAARQIKMIRQGIRNRTVQMMLSIRVIIAAKNKQRAWTAPEAINRIGLKISNHLSQTSMHSRVALTLTRLLQVALVPYLRRTKKMNLLQGKSGAKASHQSSIIPFKVNIWPPCQNQKSTWVSMNWLKYRSMKKYTM